MPNMVWVEIGSENGLPIRIFKNQKTAYRSGSWDKIAYVLRSMAVSEIRNQIWKRDNKRCTHCGNTVLWCVMQMHERIWRGRGGEVSIENGTCLCADCHQNSEVAGHGKRRVRFGESS